MGFARNSVLITVMHFTAFLVEIGKRFEGTVCRADRALHVEPTEEPVEVRSTTE
jgi:hypothetical protein